MKLQPLTFVILVCGLLSTYCTSRPEKSPNILFIIADDASFHTMSKHGANYVETPNFDQIAEKGVLFLNTYSNNPKCAPARSSLLTGRYTWQLEEAVVHRPLMPEKWKFYPELLGSEGYFVGHTGKGWGPGLWKRGEHNPAGKSYNEEKLAPPYTGISEKNYIENFKVFLGERPSEAPFCFWLGTHEPHRGYEKNSYKKAGKLLENVDVQGFFPDNDMIRGDLLDYALEVEWFDKQIGEAIQVLEEKGELENTVIIVTSDHGMPFPRVKGQIYKEGVHVPLAIRWDEKIKGGRVVNDFINFPDFAPTIMELAGLEPHPQMTGSSFLDILLSPESGWIDKTRNYSILGKERHDIGRDDGDEIAVGYPVRGIITDRFLYTVNYEPQRWPAGNPEHGFKNSDDGPTEDYLIEVSKDSLHQDYRFFELAFSFRAQEELFDLKEDPDCIQNLAFSQEYRSFKDDLSKKMTNELKNHKDPRILGYGDVFDTYYYMGFDAMKKMYGDRFLIPETLKQYENISNGKVE